MMPNTYATKVKNKLGFIKAKNICATKDTMKKVRGQFTECEEIYANYIFYKGLISRIHKEYPLERLAFKK